MIYKCVLPSVANTCKNRLESKPFTICRESDKCVPFRARHILEYWNFLFKKMGVLLSRLIRLKCTASSKFIFFEK